MQPKLIVVVGETASGKSALALKLARRVNGEIICADSWTVYKDFDIGTAKPTRLERAEVPHHLLDVADPRGGFSAAVFQQLAEPVITAIARRGKVPILVGGTGLYIDSILYHYSFMKEPSPELRAELNAMSLDELIERAEAAGFLRRDIDLRNKRRVIRLIETEGELPERQPLRPNTLIIGLKPPREDLEERIEKRTDAMLAAGLEREVHELAERYGWDCEAMKGVGYAQWRGYFEGSAALPETRAKIIKATMDLAKRQRTWFKRNKSIHWVSTPVKWQNVVELVTTFLND
ncbi:MAG TPA: tRNA (adenosine(37)-N6)-dimethylallyltransferase MiaA [Candidatus Saccharimonadales bacterium]|nr:tRNA (adenosine(37)-N6)-dimethylallyltransferase MiaA [Candidatus Saccharimonadales bacterium]